MSELRRDPLTGRFVIIAPERGQALAWPVHHRAPVGALDGDMCPFCEGQEGIAGRELLAWRTPGSPQNGPGWQLRVVANRAPVLRVESHLGDAPDALFQSFGGLGAHEVVIESPDHRANFATMTGEEVWRVLWAWRERIRDLRRDVRLKSFLVVKNVGALAGATRDHPHSQLLALPLVPQHVEDELVGAQAHYERTTNCVLCDMVSQELTSDARVIGSDDQAVVFAPFASRVPFETWIVSREHRAALEDVPDSTLRAVAERLRDVLRRLNAALLSPPYTLLVHTSPVADGVDTAVGASASGRGSRAQPSTFRNPHLFYHWHIEIIPRLQPVPGLAWDGGVHINPVAPEEAAEALRNV